MAKMAVEKEKVKTSALLVQTFSTISIAYLTSLTGFVYAWPSYTEANFRSNETMLSSPLTSMQISLLGSLTNIGGLVVTPFCGYFIDTLGRKYSVLMFGLPYVMAWTIISLTRDVNLVLFAIAIAGFGAAGQAASGVYISEIVQDSIRGGLASTTVSGYFVGLLFSYILGGSLSYHQVIYVHLSMSVLYMVLLMFLKESPVFLLQKGKEEEAAESVAFYRRVSPTSKEVEIEISKIKLQLDPRIDKILQGEGDLHAAVELLSKEEKIPEELEKISSWRFLINSESSKRALFVLLTLMTVSIWMGSIVLQVYAEPLMKEAAPTVPSSLAAILLGVTFLAASLTCNFIVDRVGRSSLFTYSSLVSAGCTLLLGIQLQLHFAPHWVTVAIIYIYTFVYTVGAATVPFILTAELFLPEVRGLCNSMSMGCMWINNFLTLIIFKPLVESIGLGPVFCGFAAICLAGAACGHYLLPETKGLPADAIQLLFLKKKKVENKE